MRSVFFSIGYREKLRGVLNISRKILLDNSFPFHYNKKAFERDKKHRGVAQLVARLVRDQEARSSNLRTPTNKLSRNDFVSALFLFAKNHIESVTVLFTFMFFQPF
jgi:hypothetical protein